MMGLDVVGFIQIRDRSCNAQNFVMGSGRKSHFIDCGAHQFDFRLAERTVLPNLATGHLSIGTGCRFSEAIGLLVASRVDIGTDLGTARSGRTMSQFVEWYSEYLNVDVDSI
jgi:hypothetical protein